MSNEKLRPETIAAHALHAVDPSTGAVVPPLYMATTYARDENYNHRVPEDYQRNGNPTLKQAEALISALERGHEALLFGSGMAAITTLFQTIPRGAHVVAQSVMYYGTRAWLQRMEQRGEITLALFDGSDPKGLESCLTGRRADLVWIETPANPTWECVDIARAAALAHASGAVLAVDATSSAAVTTCPLEYGADFVFHSVTKYLNGHSDVLAGALVAKSASARWDDIKFIRTRSSSPLAPFECWLLMRGIRTLFVRYRQASANAMTIAKYFAKHPKVSQVLYPGLPSHATHAIAKKQMTDGFGGMLSLVLDTDFNGAQAFCARLAVAVPATSLGGVESLAEHRKTVEGANSPVPDSLIRFSIGIENVDDLIADIERALADV